VPRLSLLAIGHCARDEFPDGRWRLGGSALYGAATAARLGAEVSLVTRVGPAERDALGSACASFGIALHVLPSPVTTTFAFQWDADGRRVLHLRARAVPLKLADVPPVLRRAGALLLASMARELDRSLFAPLTGSTSVLSAQGLLRAWTADGLVVPHRWEDAARLLPRVDAVVVSEEDGADIAEWLPYTTVIETHAERGADLRRGSQMVHIPAFPAARQVDPTGAGDAFAAAYAVARSEGSAPIDAARFASATASFAVEGWGMAGLAERTRVEERLRGG